MEDTSPSKTAEIAARCEEIFTDLDFNAARKWKAGKPGRKVIGFMPFYVPRELIHAAGALPLGILAFPAASISWTACCSRRSAT